MQKIKWFTNKTTNNKTFPKETNKVYDFLKLQSPDWVKSEYPQYDNLVQNTHMQLESVTLEEVQNAIECKKNCETAPGNDEISYTLLYHLPEIAIKTLTNFYNFALKYNYIPQEQKMITIIPVPKPHKDLSQINNFRPIALLSCIRKILEIIITDKLQHHLQYLNLWPRNQNGFKKGSSTLHNLAIFITDIQIAFLKKECIEAIFLDIKDAYMMMRTLQEYQLPKNLLLFIQNLLTDKIITITDQTQNIHCRINNLGLTQGSP